MMMYPEPIQQAILAFAQIPGIGEKLAEKIVLSLLQRKEEQNQLLGKSILQLQSSIAKCEDCSMYITEGQRLCSICSQENRRQDIICIVQTIQDMWQIEQIGVFEGRYHILHGYISPMEGKMPEDLTLDSLWKRVERVPVEEIIFALGMNLEGEMTLEYIRSSLKDRGVFPKYSRLGRGLPEGSQVRHMDAYTLEHSIKNRDLIS